MKRKTKNPKRKKKDIDYSHWWKDGAFRKAVAFRKEKGCAEKEKLRFFYEAARRHPILIEEWLRGIDSGNEAQKYQDFVQVVLETFEKSWDGLNETQKMRLWKEEYPFIIPPYGYALNIVNSHRDATCKVLHGLSEGKNLDGLRSHIKYYERRGYIIMAIAGRTKEEIDHAAKEIKERAKALKSDKRREENQKADKECEEDHKLEFGVYPRHEKCRMGVQQKEIVVQHYFKPRLRKGIPTAKQLTMASAIKELELWDSCAGAGFRKAVELACRDNAFDNCIQRYKSDSEFKQTIDEGKIPANLKRNEVKLIMEWATNPLFDKGLIRNFVLYE